MCARLLLQLLLLHSAHLCALVLLVLLAVPPVPRPVAPGPGAHAQRRHLRARTRACSSCWMLALQALNAVLHSPAAPQSPRWLRVVGAARTRLELAGAATTTNTAATHVCTHARTPPAGPLTFSPPSSTRSAVAVDEARTLARGLAHVPFAPRLPAAAPARLVGSISCAIEMLAMRSRGVQARNAWGRRSVRSLHTAHPQGTAACQWGCLSGRQLGPRGRRAAHATSTACVPHPAARFPGPAAPPAVRSYTTASQSS